MKVNTKDHKELKDTKFYGNILPMVHFRYRIGPMTQLRLAFTYRYRPAELFRHGALPPSVPEDEELVRGNPELKPTTAYNIDLMGEHYFQGIGIFSGGVFYKSLSNTIYDS